MTVAVALLAATFALDGGAAAAPAPPDGGASDASADGPGGPSRAAADSDAGAVDGAPIAAPPKPAVGRVAGRVFAKGTRKPVAGAALTADVAAIGETGAEGDFAFEVPCGLHRLSIQAPGFERVTTVVDACTDPSASLTLRMEPAESGHAYETVVRSKPAQQEVRLQAEELTQTPGTLGDPFRAIESLPGVATIAWPAPIYAVRGSNPGNTGFFLDGVRVPALFHFALGPSVIHPYFFDSLDFFPGGYPARYGRYVAGIVAAETRVPASDGVHSSIDVRLFDAGAMVSAPLPGGEGSVAVAGRYSYTAGLVSLLNEDVRLAYWDYQLRADRRVGPVQLTLLAFGSNDVLAPKASDATKEIDLGFHRVSLRAGVPVGGGRLLGSVAFGTDHTRAPVNDQFPVTVDALSVAPRLAFTRSFAPVDLALGFDGELSRYEPVTTVVQAQSDWDIGQRRDAYLLAGYLSSTVRAGRRLVVTPELRLDSYAISGVTANDLAPRLTARLQLRDDLALRVAGGRFTQTPSLPLQIPGVESFGLQSSWQASAGVETTRLRGFELTATTYVQRYVLTDLRDPRPNSPDPLEDDFLIRRDALSYGVELLARRPLSYRLNGWLSYTLSNNLRSFGGGAIGPSDWDQRHILNLVAGYRFGKNTVGGRLHVNTGRPYVLNDASGLVFQRLPTFYQVDLRVDHRVLYDRFVFNVYFELVNATLSRQVYSITESAPGQLQQNSFRIVMPSIGVRAEL